MFCALCASKPQPTYNTATYCTVYLPAYLPATSMSTKTKNMMTKGNGIAALLRRQQPTPVSASRAVTLNHTTISFTGIGRAACVFAVAGFVKSKNRAMRLIYYFILCNSSHLAFYYVNRTCTQYHAISSILPTFNDQ